MLPLLHAKKRSLIAFGAIYAVFFVILIYLLFFTAGLKFSKEQVGEKTKVFIENDSIHLIRDINVFANNEILEKIEFLEPGQKKELFLPEETFIELRAEAPYHAPVSTEISLSKAQNVQIDYSTSYPRPMFVGLEAKISLRLCNKGESLPSIEVEESHTTTFFGEEGKKQAVSLNEGACKTLEYALTPLQKGKTSIFFNIKALDFNESFEQEIEVE